jgi:hypothetical protein
MGPIPFLTRKVLGSILTESVQVVSKSFLTALLRKVKINFYLLTRLSVAFFKKSWQPFTKSAPHFSHPRARTNANKYHYIS